jgi:hypothetical protein
MSILAKLVRAVVRPIVRMTVEAQAEHQPVPSHRYAIEVSHIPGQRPRTRVLLGAEEADAIRQAEGLEFLPYPTLPMRATLVVEPAPSAALKLVRGGAS